MQQRVHRLISDDPDIPATTAVAARRTAARNKLFAAKGSHAVTAVAASNLNFRSIDEHLFRSARIRACGTPASLPVSLNKASKDARDPPARCRRSSHNQKCDPAETTSAQDRIVVTDCY